MNKFLLFFLILFFQAQLVFAELPFELPPKSEIRKLRAAKIVTTKGKLIVELFPNSAPRHVANFKYLADRGFYDGKSAIIFKKNYLIQFGAANENISSGLAYSIPPEFNSKKHQIGALSMVRTPDYLDIEHKRNSHSSQFRIILGESPHLDQQFTVFGQVKKGFDVLEELTASDQIVSLVVYVVP